MDLNFHFMQGHELSKLQLSLTISVTLERLSTWTSYKAAYIYTLYINVFPPQGDILLSAKQQKKPQP